MNTPSDSEAATLLREGRIAAELEIDAASLATRIPADQIRALEEGRYDALPGSAYARAFSRTLALAYNLDPDAVVAAVRRDLREPGEDSLAKRPPPHPAKLRSNAPPELPAKGNRSSKGPLVLVGVLVAALVALIGLTRIQEIAPSKDANPSPAGDSLPDTTGAPPPRDSVPDTAAAPVPAGPAVRTVSVSVRDTSRSAFLLYIKSGRVRKSTLHGLDSLVLDPDTASVFRNLSTYSLKLSGAVRRDSLGDKYFRIDRRNDSVRIVATDEGAWKKLYDDVMARRLDRNRKESR